MFRIDRFLTLHVFRHLNRMLPQPRGIRIPILMYHSICDEPEKGHPYFWINTSQKRFAEHMKFLADHDYQVIPLSRAIDLIRENSESKDPGLNTVRVGAPKPVTRSSEPVTDMSLNTKHLTLRAVVLTFDDGYADFYTHAFPVLLGYGFTATVFLPTDYIGKGRAGLRGKQHLTWDQVRELAAADITFGSHTVGHRQLYDLKPGEIQYELSASKQAIETQLNHLATQPFYQSPSHSVIQSAHPPIDQSLTTLPKVDSFCYPYKFPEQDTRFVAALREALVGSGYHCCLSTCVGVDHQREELFALKRIPVNGGDELSLFKAKLKGTYDWVSKVQLLKKGLRSDSQKRRTSPHNP